MVYDCQTLLDLRLSDDVVKLDASGCDGGAPNEGPGSPLPRPGPPSRRERPRSGRLVRLKARLVCFSAPSWIKIGAEPSLVIPRRSLDPLDAWLVPVISPEEVLQPGSPCSPRPCWHG